MKLDYRYLYTYEKYAITYKYNILLINFELCETDQMKLIY